MTNAIHLRCVPRLSLSLPLPPWLHLSLFLSLSLPPSASFGADPGSGPGPGLPPQQPPGGAGPTAAPATDLLLELDRLYARMEQSVRTIDHSRFDPQAVIEQVGRQPQRLHEWVRDRTRPLPYRGALRGAVGVLMERAGNSLDRSLLLADLLRSVGCEVRLANAKLPSGEARLLLERIAASPPRLEPSEIPGGPDHQAARERVRSLTEQLLTALRGIAPAGDAEEDLQAGSLVESLTDHWWVQLRLDGAWVDLDVTGVALPAPARTVPLLSSGDKVPLESADCHEVVLRVVIEAFKGGRLRTEPVLTQTLRPAEMLGRTINFTHFLGGSPRDADPAGSDAEGTKKLKAALLRQEVYLPALRIDDRPITEASFTTSGEVDREPKLDPAGKLASATGRSLRGSLGGLAGDDPATTSDQGVLTAEWIEYEIRVPGSDPRTVRREVFDLIGPSRRAGGVDKAPEISDASKLHRALMLLGRTQILLQPCRFHPEFVLYRSARSDLKQKEVWRGLARAETADRTMLLGALDRLSLRDTTTASFALVRDWLGPSSGRTFLDRPNIVHHRRWMVEGPSGELLTQGGMDLALTSACAAGPHGETFALRLEQGVADALAEHIALGSDALSDENTACVFEIASKNGSAPVSVSRDPEALSRLGLPPDAAARAKTDLDGGSVLVLATAEKGRWAWWRVDPRTGQTVGVMDNGFNGDLTERAKLEAEVSQYSSRLGHRFSARELENASKDQIMKWANGNKLDYVDLLQIQQELLACTGRVLARFGGVM